MFAPQCSLSILGGPACWLALAQSIIGWAVCGSTAPNEMTHKYLEHHSSSVTPQNCEKLALNKTIPASSSMFSFNAEEKLFLWHRWWDGVSVIHLTNEDSILVKRKPYPLPPVITVSMKSFPIIPLKTTPTSNMNYTQFHYEKHYIKNPKHETLECRSIYTWKLNSSWNILVWSMKNNQQWNMQPPSFNSASWSELSR